MHNAIEVINGRRSTTKLIEPGPSESELRQMFSAASAAPDHGRCRPWRFIVVPRQRAHEFGALLEEAYIERCRLTGVNADPVRCERERTRLLRAPAFLVVACQPRTDRNIPLHEQQAAVAAATQNLLLTATAMGYGSKWSTGANATDPHVKAALELGPDDSIVGFISLGSLPPAGSEKRTQHRDCDISDVVRTWCPAPHPDGAEQALAVPAEMS